MKAGEQKMDSTVVQQVREHLSTESTEELVKMLKGLTSMQYPEETYRAAEEVLVSRGVPLPHQPEIEKRSINSYPDLREYVKNNELSIEDMQQIADYRLIHKTLLPAGIGSIFFGIVAVTLGIKYFPDHYINAILAIIGFLLMLEGIWLLWKPSLKGLLADSIAIIVVGAWNSIIGIIGSIDFGGLPVLWILAFAQIGWGSQRFDHYRRLHKGLSGGPVMPPSAEVVNSFDRLVQNIFNDKFEINSNLIEFQEDSDAKQTWKAILTNSGIILVEVSMHELIFALREDIRLSYEDKRLIRKNLTCTLFIKKYKLNVTFTRKAYLRYATWKNAIPLSKS